MIEHGEVVSRDIPFASSFPTSHEEHGPTRHVFVRLVADDITGYGEGTSLLWFTGESSNTMESVVREQLLPQVVGKSIKDAITAFSDYVGRLPNNPGAKTAVEMSLLDLRGKQLGVPVANLLGPYRRTTIPCAWASGALPPSEVADNAEQAYKDGYRTFKIKADGDVDGDVARIDAVTERFDSLNATDANIRVDANTGWETYEKAHTAISRMKHKQYIEYFEQPLPDSRLGEMEELRKKLGVPIFADESVHGVRDAINVTNGSPNVSGFCAKLAKTGSLVDLTTMGRVAATNGCPVTLVSAFESSLGLAADLHIAATLPILSSATELGGGHLTQDPVVDGLSQTPEYTVPESPGLGVDLDPGLFD